MLLNAPDRVPRTWVQIVIALSISAMAIPTFPSFDVPAFSYMISILRAHYLYYDLSPCDNFTWRSALIDHIPRGSPVKHRTTSAHQGLLGA